MHSPQLKSMRVAYGFDEVALVPGEVTVNPEQADIILNLGGIAFDLPILAAAMDAVVDAPFAVRYGKLGGLAVLNLEGVQARYDDPAEVLKELSGAKDSEVTSLLQKIYSKDINPRLVDRKSTR